MVRKQFTTTLCSAQEQMLRSIVMQCLFLIDKSQGGPYDHLQRHRKASDTASDHSAWKQRGTEDLMNHIISHTWYQLHFYLAQKIAQVSYQRQGHPQLSQQLYKLQVDEREKTSIKTIIYPKILWSTPGTTQTINYKQPEAERL